MANSFLEAAFVNSNAVPKLKFASKTSSARSKRRLYRHALEISIRPVCTPQLPSSHTFARDSFLAEQAYDLLPRTDHSPGGGTGSMHEMNPTEVFRLIDDRSHDVKRVRKNRGMPPPATFDIDTLPGGSNLTALEVAAVIRRTPGALEQWRRDPNHPLKWRHVDGRPLYRVDAVRGYLAGCDKSANRPEPHNARGDGRATRP